MAEATRHEDERLGAPAGLRACKDGGCYNSTNISSNRNGSSNSHGHSNSNSNRNGRNNRNSTCLLCFLLGT